VGQERNQARCQTQKSMAVDEKHPLVKAARFAIQKAKTDGLLPPFSSWRRRSKIKCVDCGKRAQCWDHRDYSKPLEVDPVCKSCNYHRGPGLPFTEADNICHRTKLKLTTGDALIRLHRKEMRKL